jgi:TolA-binding protein
MIDYGAKIKEAKNPSDYISVLETAKDTYFSKHEFSDFVEFLKDSVKNKADLRPFASYYIGLARYSQLKYLEETQNWDEYFGQGNDYRAELMESLGEAVKTVNAKDPIYVYSKLVLWQFHRDQHDSFHEDAFEDLQRSVAEYARDAKDLAPIRAVADKFLSYEERAASKKIYKLYSDKIISSAVSDNELQNTAVGFLKQGNSELAEVMYTVYLDRISKTFSKDKLRLELIEVAKQFSYSRDNAYNLEYAESVFARLEKAEGIEVFDEQLFYTRAFNLEKAGKYDQACAMYEDFIKRFPNSAQIDKLSFKLGVIYAFVKKDVAKASVYWNMVVQSASAGPYGPSGAYMLGIVNQWQGDTDDAKKFFAQVSDKSKDAYPRTAALASARAKEIEDGKPMEYALKSFLDIALNPDSSRFDMSRVEIVPAAFIVKKGETIAVSANAVLPESGCMQVQLQYYWSGDIESEVPSQESGFNAVFNEPGTKVICVVVTTPSGVIDVGFQMIDVE